MTRERHYREQADRCLRLAETFSDPDVAAVMHRLACDYRDLATEELLRALAHQPVPEHTATAPDEHGQDTQCLPDMADAEAGSK